MIAAWFLAVPGYVLTGAVALSLLGLPDLARCRMSRGAGTSSCQPGLFGDIIYGTMAPAVMGLPLVTSIVGLLPFLWNLLWPPAAPARAAAGRHGVVTIQVLRA